MRNCDKNRIICMRQRLGQHFLRNHAVLKRTAEILDIQRGDTVIEIGPGHGELTMELLGHGANKLILLERDPALAAGLQKKFLINKNIEIRVGDALNYLPRFFYKHQTRSVKLCGNIPYYISGKLFRLLSESKYPPIKTALIIQKEVAERLTSSPPKMNLLSAITQEWARPGIVAAVGRNSFSPPPQVDSALILLEALNEKEARNDFWRYQKTAKMLFAQPRKTILNNLRVALPLSRIEAASLLEKIDVKPQDRPQSLSISDIKNITAAISKNCAPYFEKNKRK